MRSTGGTTKKKDGKKKGGKETENRDRTPFGEG